MLQNTVESKSKPSSCGQIAKLYGTGTTHKKLLPLFVARRVNEIKQNKALTIRYVPSNLNSADVATRANNTEMDNDTWLTGPSFLLYPPTKWPIDINTRREPQLLTSQVSLVEEGSSTEKEVDKNPTKEQEEIETIKKLQNDYFPGEVEGNETD